MTDPESTQAESDQPLRQLRELVEEVAAETDPDKIQTLFEQIRSLLRAQLAKSGRQIMGVRNRPRG